MLKVIALFRFLENKSYEECRDHWLNKHPEVVKKCIPGARKYVQNLTIRLKHKPPLYDGISELWFDDMDAIRNAYADEKLQAELHEDEKQFSRREGIWVIAVEHERFNDIDPK